MHRFGVPSRRLIWASRIGSAVILAMFFWFALWVFGQVWIAEVAAGLRP